LRREIFRMLEEGQSNEQIIDFLVDRYGDFVRYKPPVDARTLVLWYGPVVLLVFGFGVLAVILMRRRRANAPGTSPTLSEAERARRAALMYKAHSSWIAGSVPAYCCWQPWLLCSSPCCAAAVRRRRRTARRLTWRYTRNAWTS